MFILKPFKPNLFTKDDIGTVEEVVRETRLVDKGIEELNRLSRNAPSFEPERRRFLKHVAVLAGLYASGQFLKGCGATIAQFAFDPVYGPPLLRNRNFAGHWDGQRFTLLGIDYNVAIGTPVVATADGRVLAIQDRVVGGQSVWIEHGDGYVSFYAHLTYNSIVIKEGEQVKRGQLIAKSGHTGRTPGAHLHYGFGRLFSEGVGPQRGTLWIDPDSLGEGGGKLKLYTGVPAADKSQPESRVYYSELISRTLDEIKNQYKGESMPPAIKKVFEYYNDPNATHGPLWSPDPMTRVLKEYHHYFNDGATVRWTGGIKRMLDPRVLVPVTLTHPIQNPLFLKSTDAKK